MLFSGQLNSSSSPGQVFIPIANWNSREPPVVGDDIGPQIVHVYELLNNGPSTFSKAAVEVKWPYHFRNGSLLYITSYETEGPINCTTDMEINPLNVSNPVTSQTNSTVPSRGRESEGRNQNSVRRKRDLESRDAENDLQTLDCSTAKCLKCQVSRIERRKNAILFIYSRLAVNNFLRVSVSVVWVAEPPPPVPGWVVALAVLAGLLLLALLIFIMYKLGFFKRVRPPQEDCTEKEQLQPEENGSTDA